MNYSFQELLTKHIVIVPQIQRDYAQGRDEQLDLRTAFLRKIKHSLEKEATPLNLDFIYGFTQPIDSEATAFIPLDGQQRLTTLWLIHWYVAPRENVMVSKREGHILADSARLLLSSFTYETRLSSKRFCDRLINSSLIYDDGIKISNLIKDAAWYMASWNSDPTITAMLNTIDTIQEQGFNREITWNSLVQEKRITFDYIDIKSEEFKLTDELYIKMNSRGKPLTPFENFKAQFSALLSSKNSDYINSKLEYQKTAVNYQQYFAFKIDSTWMDLFWCYRTKVESSVDVCIMNFIYYLAEFMYLKNDASATTLNIKRDFDFLYKVFSIKQNVDFLFHTLDFVSSLNDVESFFNELSDNLSTFDSFSNDYFLRAISDKGFEVRDKILLYSVLSFCIATKTDFVSDDLKDFTRVVRNLLLAVRQPKKEKRIEYTTNLRLPNVNEYCKFIDSLIALSVKEKSKNIYNLLSENEFTGFSKESIISEKIKASLIVENPKLKADIFTLEEHNYIQGNTSVFKLTTNLPEKIVSFRKIWAKGVADSLIIRALLTIGDFSVITHDKSSLGEIWYFGSRGCWNRILTATDRSERNKVSEVLDLFLLSFIDAKGDNAKEKLKFLIDRYNDSSRDWRYYFIKYENITNNPYKELNLFAWDDSNGFNIHSLGNSGPQPLHSYHINPYLTVLQQKFKDNPSIRISWDRFTYPTRLVVKNNFLIECSEDGWKLLQLTNYKFDKQLIDKYNLILDGSGYYLLKETDKKDRIEIAFEFIEELLIK